MSDQLRKRILTGDRPTGKLHLGHYIGSHRNRLKFQEQYECFFLIADLHMLTTKNSKDDILSIADNRRPAFPLHGLELSYSVSKSLTRDECLL